MCLASTNINGVTRMIMFLHSLSRFCEGVETCAAMSLVLEGTAPSGFRPFVPFKLVRIVVQNEDWVLSALSNVD